MVSHVTPNEATRWTFCEFMEAALYHPEQGYYLRSDSPLGAAGDFMTAPDHHAAFGRLIGKRVVQVLREIGSGTPRVVVEMGAGSGALAEGVLAHLAREATLEEVRYRIVEPFPVWRARQEARLHPYLPRVDWTESLKSCPPFAGVFLSNELPDAFPVHRVIRRGDCLRELWVHATEEGWAEQEGELSTPALREYFHRLGYLPQPDRVVEVSLELRPWAQGVAQRLQVGAFLTLDYGATAEELYLAGPPGGRLRSYRGHRAEDPLACPGRQDLTAPVDFTTLRRTGLEAGLTVRAFTTQRHMLLALGWEREWRDPDSTRRRALLDLVDPNLMGGTRVLELRRP